MAKIYRLGPKQHINQYMCIYMYKGPVEKKHPYRVVWVIGVIWVSLEKGDFWAKNGPWRPPRRPPCNGVNTKCCFLLSRHDGYQNFGWALKKIIFLQKKALLAKFWPFSPKISFWHSLNGDDFLSPDPVVISKYQNLPMYPFQKCLSYAIFYHF